MKPWRVNPLFEREEVVSLEEAKNLMGIDFVEMGNYLNNGEMKVEKYHMHFKNPAPINPHAYFMLKGNCKDRFMPVMAFEIDENGYGTKRLY